MFQSVDEAHNHNDQFHLSTEVLKLCRQGKVTEIKFVPHTLLSLAKISLFTYLAQQSTPTRVKTAKNILQLYLSKSGADPYSNEYRITIETFEDVALTVNLACINFVEQRHQNERVEYDREMLWRWRVHCSRVVIATTVDVKCHVAYTPHANSNVNSVVIHKQTAYLVVRVCTNFRIDHRLCFCSCSARLVKTLWIFYK